MRILFVAILALAAGTARVVAQDAAAPPPPAAKPTLQQLGMVIYPAKGQSEAQTKSDTDACYAWAEKETGIDLSKPADVNASAEAARKQAADKTTGATVVGAGAGAAGGAMVGAITGDAGTGAAVGAVVGAMRGRRAKKMAEGQAAQQGAAAATSYNQAQANQIKKAAAVCLQGKGYTAQ